MSGPCHSNLFRNSARVAAGLVLFFGVLVTSGCGGGASSSSYQGGSNTSDGGNPLIITTSSFPDGVVSIPYQQTLTASGGTSPFHWSQDGNLPNGLTLDPNSGMIIGRVDFALSVPVTFYVQDSGSTIKNTTKNLQLNFNWPLTIDTKSVAGGHLNAPYDAIIQSSGPATGIWQISSGSLPPGLLLTNQSTTQVEIAGTPTAAGSYQFTLQVQSASNPPQVVQQDYTLVVDTAFVIATPKLLDGIAGMGYSTSLTTVNGTPPCQWSAIGLPAALVIDSATGTISGVPIAAGNYQPTITVIDSASRTASQIFGYRVAGQLAVQGSDQNPFQFPDANLGSPYYYGPQYSGGTGTINWSIIAGALPPGIVLNSPQVPSFVGQPSQIGSYFFTVQGQDSGAPQQTVQLKAEITVRAPVLRVASSLPEREPTGVAFDWLPQAIGGIAPYHWSTSSGSLPPGLMFNPSNGEISGTPTALGYYLLVIQVTDSDNKPQSAIAPLGFNIYQALGRNDTTAHATPLGDGGYPASISPYADPPDSESPVPDSDYYKIVGNAGAVVSISTMTLRVWGQNVPDTVLEIVDVNGVRFNSCRLPGDFSDNFNSNCMNDDIQPGVQLDSKLDIKVPGETGTQVVFYVHVLDGRGDARPDMRYWLTIAGSVLPLKAIAPTSLFYGSWPHTLPAACPVNVPCSAQFTSIGGTGAVSWAFDAGALPPGMTLSPTGVLDGVPTAAGNFTMVVRATDSSSPTQTADISFTLTVDTNPTVTTASLPDAYTGQFYIQQLSATGGTPPYTWNYRNQDANTGLFMNSNTGVLAGMPSVPGTYDIDVGVADLYSMFGNSHLLLTIRAGSFSFPNATYPDGAVGYGYSFSIRPTGGTPPYRLVVVSGAVPPGLTFDNGLLIGEPTSAGTYTFAVTATDSSSQAQTATATMAMTVTR